VRNGFSLLPPPATSPTVALHPSLTRMFFPDGSLTIALPFALEKSTADVPDARTSLPPSPGLSSKLQTRVPSGILESGMMFPSCTSDAGPRATCCPTDIPATAGR
jgi:hypothetical protein